jgi:hypothetical protein
MNRFAGASGLKYGRCMLYLGWRDLSFGMQPVPHQGVEHWSDWLTNDN